ncbi:MAG: CvpA family protein [Bordetella sp.]|jgi:membrane protein required for colicin V production
MLALTWIDWVFLVVTASSTLLAFLRGLVHEVLALASWVVAFIAASQLAGYASEPLPHIFTEPVRLAMAFAIVFFITLFIGRFVSYALKELVAVSGVQGFNRFLGAFFGFGRGLLIMSVLAVLAALTSLPSDSAWQNAWSKPVLELSVQVISSWLPSYLSDRIVVVS